jgi:hypothetical protein
MALSEFFQRQRQYTPKASAVRKAAVWRARGSRYLRGYNIRFDPSMLVRPDPKTGEKILALIGQVYPAIAGAFDKHMGRLAVEAFDRWPIETGLSKSLLGLEYFTREDTLSGQFVCTAPYAYFIRDRSAERRRAKNRSLSSAELEIMSNPPDGVSRQMWQQACLVASRRIDPITYGYCVGVAKRIKGATGKRRRTRRGRRVADRLVFRPGKKTAQEIAEDIAKALGD